MFVRTNKEQNNKSISTKEGRCKMLLLNRGMAISTAAIVAITAGVVLAASPHFIDNKTKADLDNDLNLVISFKEAGLGDNEVVHYEATADATATYHCVNNGGKCPSAANKEEVNGPVVGEGTFQAGKNGQITASITIMPPPSTLECPPGQPNQKVTEVSYTGPFVLTDTDNNVSTSPSETFFAETEPCDQKGNGNN